MDGVIYYFSGTGNTKWAAEKFKSCFELYGIPMKLVNIEKERVEDIEEDIIVIGTPIYFGEIPKFITTLVSSLPRGNSCKKCILFATHSRKSSAALDLLAGIIKKKGYNVVAQICIELPANFKLNSGRTEAGNSDIMNLVDSGAAKIKTIVKDCLVDKYTIERTPTLSVLFKMGRRLMGSPKRIGLGRYLSCSQQCISCGLCLRNCPCGNITLENRKVVFHSHCVMCMRCMYICPKEAINYRGRKLIKHNKLVIGKLDII